MENKSADYLRGQLDVFIKVWDVVHSSIELGLTYPQAFNLICKELNKIHEDLRKDIKA